MERQSDDIRGQSDVMSPHRVSVRRVDADLKEPREHIGWLTPDDKKPRVELPQVGVQILQTLEEKAEQEREERGGDKHLNLSF